MPDLPDPALQTALAELCAAVGLHLARRLDSGVVPPMQARIHVTRQPPAPPSLTTWDVVDWRAFVQGESPAVLSLPAYTTALEVMEEDPVISHHLGRNVQTGHSGSLISAGGSLEALIVGVLERTGPHVESAGVDAIIQAFLSWFYSTALPMRLLAPIYSMNIGEDLDLGAGLRLIRLDEDDHNLIAGTSGGFSEHRYFPCSPPPLHAFEAYVRIGKHLGPFRGGRHPEDRTDEVMERIEMAITVLRLYQRGPVFSPELLLIFEPRPSEIAVSAIGEGYAPRFLTGEYALESDDLARFLAYWETATSGEVDLERVQAATRRFNFGYGRPRLEDRLVDYVIALESVLGIERSGAYQVCLAGAALVGENPAHRREVFDRLREAFKKRNRVVHRGATIADARAQEFVDDVEDEVRRVIRRFTALARLAGENQALEALEARIVSGEYAES
jgi:hypothetical protein